MQISKFQIYQAIEKIKKSKVVLNIVGDLILDEYLIGFPERISREAPVLILEFKENYYRLGGACNAAINAAKLGVKVNLIGTVGKDKEADIMKEICEQNGIELKVLYLEDKPTTLKTRILSANQSSKLLNNGTTFNQQVLRVDRHNKRNLTQEEEQQIIQLSQEGSPNAILLSDYNLGVLGQQVCKNILKSQIKVIVDPSSDFTRFSGAYMITPNHPDTENELGLKLDYDDDASLIKAQEELQKIVSRNTNFLVTCGADGMVMLQNNNPPFKIPAFNKAEVFDVTGAGDTVSACASVASAAGIGATEAMILGNLAAGLVVRKPGAATTNLEEILEELEKNTNKCFVN